MSAPVKLTEEQAQIATVIASQVYAHLLQLYPLEPDRSLLEHHAQHAGVEQVMEMPKYAEVLSAGEQMVALQLVRPSKLAGGKDEELAFNTVWPLEKADTLERALKTATILALVNSPTARAIIAKNGYRLRFLAEGPKGKKSKVVDIGTRRGDT